MSVCFGLALKTYGEIWISKASFTSEWSQDVLFDFDKDKIYTELRTVKLTIGMFAFNPFEYLKSFSVNEARNRTDMLLRR